MAENLFEVTAASGLRLREFAPDGPVVSILPRDAVVEKIGTADAPGWMEVRAKIGASEETGFVSETYLLPREPKPSFRVPFFSSLSASYDRVRRFVGDPETVFPNYDATVLPQLNAILRKYKITSTPLRFAHFMAQIAHESAHFRAMEENLNYSGEALWRVFRKYFESPEHAEQYARQPERIANRVYANRIGNGDEASGDGWRYRGRGFIQLTGRANYREIGEKIGVELETDPDRVSQNVDVALEVAAAYWDSRKLNRLADRNDIAAVTRAVNGGYHGLDDRKRLFQQARAIWG